MTAPAGNLWVISGAPLIAGSDLTRFAAGSSVLAAAGAGATAEATGGGAV